MLFCITSRSCLWAHCCLALSLPIGRHPTQRKKMSTLSSTSRRGEALWQIEEWNESTDISIVGVDAQKPFGGGIFKYGIETGY
jgi:hypothetical protein